MDSVVVARTQRCRHAPCRTSVALWPEPAPNPEGNAGGSARVQVTFSPYHQQHIGQWRSKGVEPHSTTTTNHRVSELGGNKRLVSALSPKLKWIPFLALSRTWSGQEASPQAWRRTGCLVARGGSGGGGGRGAGVGSALQNFGTSVDSGPWWVTLAEGLNLLFSSDGVILSFAGTLWAGMYQLENPW